MKEQFIKNAQAQFLKETVEFFHTGNRATTQNGCVYRPTANSPGCAIGRHLVNKDLCEMFDWRGGLGAWLDSQYIDLGPLAVLGVNFLAAVQQLHDSQQAEENSYWNETGLSERGRDRVEQICYDYGLEFASVIKPTNPPAE